MFFVNIFLKNVYFFFDLFLLPNPLSFFSSGVWYCSSSDLQFKSFKEELIVNWKPNWLWTMRVSMNFIFLDSLFNALFLLD